MERYQRSESLTFVYGYCYRFSAISSSVSQSIKSAENMFQYKLYINMSLSGEDGKE